MATRWTTASTPAIAGASVSGRVTSPIRISTPSRRSAGSRPMTISPAVGVRTSATTRWPARQQGGHVVAADEAAGAGHEDGRHGRRRSIGGVNDPATEPPAGAALRRVVEAMPKAELHLHLDGSLRIETALELARTRGIDAPTDAPGMAAALIAPMPCADQAELLRAFDLPIALMQDAEALERITTELVETKAADGVRYVEIRWGPLLHVAGGLSLADGIAAVCAGARARRGADRDGRPAHLHGPALARAGGQRDPGRDRRQVPRRGADRLGPGRTRGGLPGPAGPREGLRGGARGRPADHAPRRRVGRRGPGRAGRWRSTPSGSRTVRAPSTTRRCAPSSSRGA